MPVSVTIFAAVHVIIVTVFAAKGHLTAFVGAREAVVQRFPADIALDGRDHVFQRFVSW